MILLGAVLSLASSPDSELTAPFAVLYLARHQGQDGSWGGRPPHCTCADPRPPARGVDLPHAADLIRRLGDDDPGLRLDAQRELLAMGPDALPVLAKAQEAAEPEVRARCGEIASVLAGRARGTGDVELTGHCLLLLLGAGFSHFSKDTYEDICIGPVITKGLAWLQGRLGADGRFGTSDVAANAVAALALCEAYGLTGSARFKDDAQRAATAAARVEVGTPRELVWTAFLAVSARSALLEGDWETHATRLVEALGKQPGILTSAGRRYLQAILKVDAARLDLPGVLDPETRCVAAAALLASEGSRSERWKSWGTGMKDALVSRLIPGGTRCDRGTWDAPTYRERLRTTALNGHSLQIYYRYANQFAVPR